ncbi:MAG TPA: hypothetical protein VN873_18975 [Candidatus Angelobacter sp.]|nr:hypothetical protein [Candidatus Angelobacter sp.]
MKTPREILLEHHRSAHAKLDAVRTNALREIADGHSAKEDTSPNHVATPWMFFRELFLPARGVWKGLAACWAVILVLHFAARDSSPTVAKTLPPPSPGMLQALRPQQELLAELLSGDTKPTNAEQPRRSHPSPRTEIRSPAVIA